MKIFNKDELAKYDGKEGRPAYVAYLGKVYDFSDTHEAEHGDHYGHRVEFRSQERRAVSGYRGTGVSGKNHHACDCHCEEHRDGRGRRGNLGRTLFL
jgi:hypothetical protein